MPQKGTKGTNRSDRISFVTFVPFCGYIVGRELGSELGTDQNGTWALFETALPRLWRIENRHNSVSHPPPLSKLPGAF